MPSVFTSDSTADAAEINRFTAIAEQWWNESGKFAPLHRLNPARIGYIRDQVLRHFSGSATDDTARPLQGIRLLDIGCGGGLIAEPMARLGASVTGIDAGEENIAVAQLHAQQSGLAIDYRVSTAEALAFPNPQSPTPSFDVVLALEIIEHVVNPDLFYAALAALVRPGGLLILSTLNRTAKSYLMAIVGAEYVLRWLPRGTHSWRKFIRPSEMAHSLTTQGLTVMDTAGIVYHPLTQRFRIDPQDLDVNYLLVARK